MCEVQHGQRVQSSKKLELNLPHVILILLNRRFKVKQFIFYLRMLESEKNPKIWKPKNSSFVVRYSCFCFINTPALVNVILVM